MELLESFFFCGSGGGSLKSELKIMFVIRSFGIVSMHAVCKNPFNGHSKS